jgi:hypothetical protein
MLTGRFSLYLLGMQAGLAVIVVVSATVLGVYGALDSSSLTAIYGAALGFAGGASSSLGALSQAVNGKATISDAALRQAMASPPHPPQADSPEQN